jgi:hypothetical protein
MERHNLKYAARQDLKLQIRSGYVLTAKAIFSDFLRNQKKGYVFQGCFQTSDSLIKEATKSPLRTVKDHINRLIETGFILRKVQRLEGVAKSKEYNYFLEINPGFYAPEEKPP